MPSRSRPGARWLGTVFLVAVVLNFGWEMAQAYLYETMGTAWEAARRCLLASVGDGALVLAVLVTARRVVDRSSRAMAGREYALSIALGVAMAVAVEWWGLGTGRWVYRAAMPKFPGTPLGLVPILQMAALTPLILWLADRADSSPPRGGR